MVFMFSSLPVNGPLRITSRYGARNTGIKGASTFHKGIDLGRDFSKPETQITAVKAGRVKLRGWTRYRGWYVVLSHGPKYETLYQHLKNEPLVSIGQRVKAGDVLGIMGNSADPAVLKIAVHLHFELHENGKEIDPEPYLKNIEPEVTDMTETEIRALIKEILNGSGSDVSSWAKNSVQEAKALGITDGTRPGGYLTREEGITLIMRALSKING